MTQPPFRVGSGFDVHRLVEGRKLILGGIEVPHSLGLDGHSDADALLHALCDSILGALAAGDIGQHFRNDDPRWKDCDSKFFVKEVVRLVEEKGYYIGNADMLIIAERPKLMGHLPAMQKCIAELLKVSEDCVGLKAGTNEKMGFVGREEGIAAMATVCLIRKDQA